MSKTNIFLSIAFGILLLGSCAKDVGKLPPVLSACDTITYTKHIKPIFDSACATCHGSVPQPGAPPFNSYDDVKTYVSNGEIYSTVFIGTPNPMPQGGSLTQRQLSKLKCWLDNGGKE